MITGHVRVSSREQKLVGNQIAGYVNMFVKNGIDKDNILIEEALSGSFDEDKDMEIIYDEREGYLRIEFDIRRKRRKFDEFINEYILKNKVTTHYIPDWRTLVRNILLQEALIILFNKHGCNIQALNDTNDIQGRMIMGVLNQIESENTKKRIGLNKQFRFDQGLYMGTARMKGYKKTKIRIDGKEFTQLIPNSDPKEIELINDVFSNKNYRDVCNKHRIDPKTYYNTLHNKFYAGYIKYKGEEKKGRHEPLICLERWEKWQ